MKQQAINQKQGNLIMTKESIIKLVKDNTQSIVDQQKVKGVSPKWGQREHHAMLRKCVVTIAEEELAGEGEDTVEELGISIKVMLDEASAGNTSAYRQGLEKSGVIGKAAATTDEYQ